MSTYGSGLYGAGLYEGSTWAEEMARLKGAPILLVEIDLDTGTEYYASASVRFPAQHYEGRLLRTGAFRRAMQQNLGLFETASVEAWFEDADSFFATRLESEAIKGRIARFKIGSQGLPLVSFVTIFEGKIDDYGVENFQFRILVRDRLWNTPEKPDVGTVNVDDFPYALPEDVGKPLPFCYGEHSFTTADYPATGDVEDARMRGAWPTLYVDVRDTQRTFLVARHAVKSIDEVYAYKPSAGSQLLVLTTDYTVQKAGLLKGETMAYIQLTSAGFTKLIDTNALGVLTCNVEGKEDAGDGTGTLITNPVEVLQDILETYLEAPALNGGAFNTAALVATARNYVCAGGYTKEAQADEVLRDLCKSFQMRLYPDTEGKVGVSIYQPIAPGASGLDVREQWEILAESFGVDFVSDVQGAEDANIINSIDYKNQWHFAIDNFRVTGTLADSSSISRYGVKALVLDLPWAHGSSVGDEVATRLLSLYKNPVGHASMTVPLVGMNVDVAGTLNITHEDGPDGGYDDRAFEVLEHTFDPNNMTVSMRAKDVSVIGGNAFFFQDEDPPQELQSDGTAAVTNGDATVTLSAASDMTATGVQAGDTCEFSDPTNETNRQVVIIAAAITSTQFEAEDSDGNPITVWVNESGMTYRILTGYDNGSTLQQAYGHLCDEVSGKFGNGDDGKELL